VVATPTICSLRTLAWIPTSVNIASRTRGWQFVVNRSLNMLDVLWRLYPFFGVLLK